MPDSEIKALIFDVDGTLAETEEAHRQAFNAAFVEFGLDWNWSIATYTELLTVTGGKERIDTYMSRTEYRPDIDIAAVHACKTEFYLDTVRSGGIALRDGVEHLLVQAHFAGLELAVATTTSRCNVDELIAGSLNRNAEDLFSVICCGEDVENKKPHPEVYSLALSRLGLAASQCIAFEDSAAGLKSARASGLPVVITPSRYTRHHDFSGADLVVSSLDALPVSAPDDWKLSFRNV